MSLDLFSPFCWPVWGGIFTFRLCESYKRIGFFERYEFLAQYVFDRCEVVFAFRLCESYKRIGFFERYEFLAQYVFDRCEKA